MEKMKELLPSKIIIERRVSELETQIERELRFEEFFNSLPEIF
jgi:hypothetical protein